ncbi:DUF484 family protein [Pseudidiomarina terrestris]|uniref:DUF484 family protein n=1 Tax=Pseudidiomarina terrestris TaxID=2820060 RepID=A0AAW7QZ63_9GAMM|nr:MULTISPECIES: DUF484 family protein [unclassified Pseudidiomarina]MDN7124716.1 DUF484 family protein [Pseudidiomarina sp. 1APP75-32.1]MDN7129810.1 DUF484 family protein [Pseudidiomarina sp. 1APR75-15]MDN7136413.1 DUF484 family protein [Pseudidiomarina sp. 1ASP75-5]MDN7137933.1 DUF484 family protein [Pseudidiomarina sp. 1ASP75-14]MEA3588297.1 DUF484 family protein [Pseudidiomarina sp. 1APP75-27a]
MSTEAKKQAQQTRVDDTLIAAYLEENPDFFDRHPELLQQLSVRHQTKGAVSLVERQQQVLRQRVQHLEEEITELMVTARRNEELFRYFSELYLKLLQSQSIEEVMDSLQQTFSEQLQMPALTLKFFDSPLELETQFTFAADTHKQLLSKRFRDDSIYLGRLTTDEQKLLFPDESIASVVLLLLGDKGELGMLAIGNHDAGHFEPAMDTLLVKQLQVLLSQILPPLLKHHEAR